MLQCNGIPEKIPSFGISRSLSRSIEKDLASWPGSDDIINTCKTGFAFYTSYPGFSKSFS